MTGDTLLSTMGNSMKINQFLFSTFHGGSNKDWAPSKTVHARYDNFAVYPGFAIRPAR